MPTLSAEEKLGRSESMASVLGTHAMEGLLPDEATKKIMRRYSDGELTLEEFSAAMDAYGKALVEATRLNSAA